MSGPSRDPQPARPADATTAEISQSQRQIRIPTPPVGLVCMQSASLQLGDFVAIEKETAIGRASGVDVQLTDDAALSRVHCRVSKDGAETLGVVDLQSRNGTFVNGSRIDSARLKKGDLLRLGESLFLVSQRRPSREDDVLVGVSEEISETAGLVTRFAGTPLPALIVGETGTGKELVAQRLHSLSGRTGRLVPINAAAIPETLAESTLFGHVKGAFSGAIQDQAGVFEQAANGTLFLDEIGELSPILQAKLLRVLEGGDFTAVGSPRPLRSSARVVAATNRDLTSFVANGSFRADLYARLAGAVIHLAPLRSRRIDIPYLFRHFLGQFAPQRKLRPSAELLETLMLEGWPMNIRELRQCVNRLVFDQPDVHVLVIDGQLPEPRSQVGADTMSVTRPIALEPQTREQFEKEIARLRGNVVQLAKHYGRTRKQIYRWAEAFGINLDAFR